MIKKTSFTLLAVLLLSVFACTSNSTSTEKKSEPATTETEKKETRKMLTEAEKADYIKKGKAIAKSSFVALSTNLKKAMIKGNVIGALEYCNTKASPIIDSLSKAHNAIIRRTTSKIRNQDNIADEKEDRVLKLYEKAAKTGAPLKPHVSLNPEDNTVSFYAPIKLKEVCLKCHGTVGKEVLKSNYAIIKKLYPEDDAMGYKEGDFRGMWSIKMK